MELTASKKPAQKTDKPRTRSDSLMRWRREKVWELKSMGLTIDEIVDLLKGQNQRVKISHGTVCNDLKAKEREIRDRFNVYIEEELPTQHALAITGLEKVIKESWRIYVGAEDQKVALTALATIADATMKKQAVLGDPAQIEKAIKLAAKLREQAGQQQVEQ